MTSECKGNHSSSICLREGSRDYLTCQYSGAPLYRLNDSKNEIMLRSIRKSTS